MLVNTDECRDSAVFFELHKIGFFDCKSRERIHEGKPMKIQPGFASVN